MKSAVLVNGVVSDGLVSVADSSVIRGDGCFEVIRAYGGRLFARDLHLDRLQRSAGAMGLALPPRDLIAEWVEETAAQGGDCVVRVVVTRGSLIKGVPGEPSVIVFAHDFDQPPSPARLLPVVSPWNGLGTDWVLAGAKTLSYAPNVASTRLASDRGYSDALLVSAEGVILEGPTFSVAWVRHGAIETPSLELGILESITRGIVLDLARDAGLAVVEGRWSLPHLAEASEVMAFSTLREVQAVSTVGEMAFVEGEVTADLSRRYVSELG